MNDRDLDAAVVELIDTISRSMSIALQGEDHIFVSPSLALALDSGIGQAARQIAQAIDEYGR